MADIKRAYTLFHDEARTVQFLNEYSREFLYNEDGDSEDEYDEVRFSIIISKWSLFQARPAEIQITSSI